MSKEDIRKMWHQIVKALQVLILSIVRTVTTVLFFWQGSLVGKDGRFSSRKATALVCFAMFIASWYMHVFEGRQIDSRFTDYTFLGAMVCLGIITVQNVVDIITGKKNYIFSDKTNVFGRGNTINDNDDEFPVTGHTE